MKGLTRVTTYHTHGHAFDILRDDEGKYWGIPSEDIQNGRLVKPYNGITGHRTDSLSEVLDRLEQTMEIRRLKDEGIPTNVAVYMVACHLTEQEVRQRFVAADVQVENR